MKTRHLLRKIVIGLIFISAGLLLLGFNLNILPQEWKPFFFTWKILIVLWGIILLVKRNHFFFGSLVLLCGLFLYTPLVYPIQMDFSKLFWPAVLILGGISIIVHRHTRHICNDGCSHKSIHESYNYKRNTAWNNYHFEKSESKENYIDDVLFFSGNERIIESKHFEGGKIVSFFGGLKLNLLNSELAPGKNTLEVVIGFGGCQLIVPNNWAVRVDAVSIFGGFTDKRVIVESNQNPENILIIKGVAIFGGGEIKNA